MGNEGCGGCAGNLFNGLEPERQAHYLAMLAQDARLLQFSLEGEDEDARRIGDSLQRALANAIDAEGPDEAKDAERELRQLLTEARAAGMQLSAETGEVDVDGVLGTMKMRVLSTVLTAAPALGA